MTARRPGRRGSSLAHLAADGTRQPARRALRAGPRLTRRPRALTSAPRVAGGSAAHLLRGRCYGPEKARCSLIVAVGDAKHGRHQKPRRRPASQAWNVPPGIATAGGGRLRSSLPPPRAMLSRNIPPAVHAPRAALAGSSQARGGAVYAATIRVRAAGRGSVFGLSAAPCPTRRRQLEGDGWARRDAACSRAARRAPESVGCPGP